MFTKFKNGKWNYMFLAAVATLAVAAMAAMLSARSTDTPQNRAEHETEQVITGRSTQYNTVMTRFVN